jgi:hypothetical protein
MKPTPAPNVEGKTAWEKLDRAFRTVLRVPKEALLKEEAKIKQRRQKKRAKKPG